MKETSTFVAAIKTVLARADRILTLVIQTVCILCFTGLFFLALANVFIRFAPVFSLHFFDEVQQWLLGSMIFWGAAGLWMLRDHLKVDDIAKMLFRNRNRLGTAVNLLIDLASLFFMAVFINVCYDMSMTLMGETNYLRVPERIVYLTAMLVPGFIMGLYAVRNVVVSAARFVRVCRRTEAAV